MQMLHVLLGKHLQTRSFSRTHCSERTKQLKRWIKARFQGAALSSLIQNSTFQSHVCLQRNSPGSGETVFLPFHLLWLTEPAQSIDLARQADGI